MLAHEGGQIIEILKTNKNVKVIHDTQPSHYNITEFLFSRNKRLETDEISKKYTIYVKPLIIMFEKIREIH
jgi:TusA-related sulfurtransferase